MDLHLVFVDHSLKAKKKLQQFKETVDSQNICENDLDKTCFQHDIAYEAYKYLTRKTASDKILRDKAFDIAKNPKFDRYKRGIASMVYKFFDKKASAVRPNKFAGSGIKNENMSDQQLAEE